MREISISSLKRVYNLIFCPIPFKHCVFFLTFCMVQAVTNFVTYKYRHLAAKDQQIIYGLANMFLKCINHCTLESPSQRSSSCDDVQAYKVNYTRCVLFIAYCILLPHQLIMGLQDAWLLLMLYHTNTRNIALGFVSDNNVSADMYYCSLHISWKTLNAASRVIAGSQPMATVRK